jgi:uncharacterized membrane protein required for colicin V production
MSWRCRLLFGVLFFGPALYFKFDGDVILSVVCAVAGLAAFGGYRAGAASILALIVGFAVAIAYAPAIGLAQEWRLSQTLGTTGLTNRFLSIAIAGLLIGAIVVCVVTWLLRRVFDRRPQLATLNRWIGFGFGAAEGVVAMVFFLGGMLVIEPIEREVGKRRDANDARGQKVSRFVLATTDLTRESLLGPTIAAYNPFVRIPSLNKVEQIQRSVQVLGDPTQIDQLLEHPSIQELQQRPEMRHAMEQLRSDAELNEILHSGRPMSAEAMMTLMNHPAVLDLIDQPGFVEEAMKLIRSSTVGQATRLQN